MSAAADTMRAAAAKMRDRAEQAGDGEWLPEVLEGGRAYVDTPTHDIGFHDMPHLVPHVASWDPVTARAAADLMDAGAAEFDRREEKHGTDGRDAMNTTGLALVNLARTYLGEEA